MVTVQKNDFVEIEFTGKTQDGVIFDTNIKSEAEKIGLRMQAEKPFILSIGHGMLLAGFDKELEGKELNKEYSIELSPENAFGKRNSALVKMIPLKLFLEQKINPQAGMQLSLDGNVVKIMSVSSGRVLVDFNNPLAGKVVTYTYKIKRKVEDKNEQINALQDFFMRKRFDFTLNNKEITFKIPKNLEQFIQFFARPFKDILGLNVKSEVVENNITSSEEKK
jgi:FKBP-type peptidyl-prolyl cis-trans isomerase 2